MNHVEVTYTDSDTFVEGQQKNGNRVSWDGWDMVFFLPARRAIYSNEGVRSGTEWGFTHRVSVDDLGIWRVPKRYVKFTRRTRN